MTDVLADLGEFGLIKEITARFPPHAGLLIGPGDDAALLSAPDGRVVATTDLLLEGRHFRRDYSSGYEVGRKAAAQNLADVVAMGARPTGLLVGLAAPGDLPVRWALDLADGLRDECAEVDAYIAGGDVSSADRILLAITALGDLAGAAPVRRSGARPGDQVVVAGRLGWAQAGLELLAAGADGPRELLDAHRRPRPPYAAGLALAAAGATAMCDVSDGLLADVGHVASASNVRVELSSAAFDMPEPLRAAAAALGADPLRWTLTGGDDNAFVACLPHTATLPAEARQIGTIAEGSGVLVDATPYTGPQGWDHYRRP